MNSRRLLLLAGLAAVSLLFTGCASRTISAASTRLEVATLGGRSVVVSLPKEVEAEGLVVEVNPATGAYTLRADRLVTKSEAVIDAAGSAQAAAITALAGAVQTLTANAASAAVAP
jgi:hypothetical protein